MRGPHLRTGPLKGLRRVRQDGKLYIYHRASGTRLPDLAENHPDFIAAYQAAQDSPRPTDAPGKARTGTLAALWQAYKHSAAFRTLSDSYRNVRRRDGDRLARKAATVAVAAIRAHHIRNDLAALDPNPARERRKTWRAMMAFALDRGLIREDPSQSIATPRTPKATQHAPWTRADCAAFRTHWPLGTTQRTAFELLQWTGARIADVAVMGAGMVDRDGWLDFRQQKTGGKVAIPLHRQPPAFADPADWHHVRAAIEAVPTRHMTWLTTEAGHSRSPKSASQWFSAAARNAGITGKTAHGLRVTRAIRLAEGGATTNQIGAWTGHESLKEIAHYSHQADRKRLLAGTDPDQILVQAVES